MNYDDLKPFMPDKRIICVTEVGSGMWNMRELSSDYDLVVIYSENMVDFLRGHYRANLPCRHGLWIAGQNEGEAVDISYMELGHWINLIKKGNINAIWAALTPSIFLSSGIHALIAQTIRDHPTKAIMPSLEGMVNSQLADAVKRASVRSPAKSLATAMRTIQFGENLVKYQDYRFEPSYGELLTEEYARIWLSCLKNDMAKSSLCDKIPPEKLDDILINYRWQMCLADLPERYQKI